MTQQPMSMAEFKMYRRQIMMSDSKQPPNLWLVLKRSGPGKHDFSPIGKARFRGATLPFKTTTNWRNYRLYVSPIS